MSNGSLKSIKALLPWLYIAFAISGAVFPTLANFEYLQEYGPGFDVGNFIHLANINPAAKSLSRDLAIGAGSIMIWILSESFRLRIRNVWLVFLCTFLISFACAAPLFLFLRERRLLELERNGRSFDIDLLD